MCARVHRNPRSRATRCLAMPHTRSTASRPSAPSPVASRRTWERRCSPPGRTSRTSARSRSAWRWAARCGATSSIGFASQLGELRLGFTQLAALYVLADGSTTTVGELAEALGRSPSATSRLVDGLARRRLVERHLEPEDRRQRSLALTQRGQAILRAVDRARADQFLTAVRPMPTPERALVAMGVAALATHAISRRGRLIKGRQSRRDALRRGSSSARPSPPRTARPG